jgi:hypothetical protein
MSGANYFGGWMISLEIRNMIPTPALRLVAQRALIAQYGHRFARAWSFAPLFLFSPLLFFGDVQRAIPAVSACNILASSQLCVFGASRFILISTENGARGFSSACATQPMYAQMRVQDGPKQLGILRKRQLVILFLRYKRR